MEVSFENEPDYELVAEGVRRMFMAITPEQRRRYAASEAERGKGTAQG